MSTVIKPLTEKQALVIYAKAWNQLEPEELIRHLADNVRYTSQAVLEDMTTADEVADYLRGKMDPIRNSPEDQVFAELAETQPYPMAPNPPRPCVLVAQSDPDNLLAVVLIKVSGGKIASIDLCSVAPAPHTVKRSGDYPE